MQQDGYTCSKMDTPKSFPRGLETVEMVNGSR